MKWKDNAPYVLCLSHDVDRTTKQWYHYGYYGLRHPIVQMKSLINKVKGNEPYWNFEKIMAIEKKFGVRSTFFFLNESHHEISADFMGRYKITSRRVMDIIRKLDKEGFEIGLHGSFNSYKNLNLLQKEKTILEQIVGHQIVSTRQHHLNLNKKTWKYQKQIGIKFDSTIGYSNQVGNEEYCRIRCGIIEIPITIMDTIPLGDEVYDKCCNLAKKGGIIMLNFHQCHFNKTEYPQNVEIYMKLLEKAISDKAWITNMKEVGEWLDERI